MHSEHTEHHVCIHSAGDVNDQHCYQHWRVCAMCLCVMIALWLCPSVLYVVSASIGTNKNSVCPLSFVHFNNLPPGICYNLTPHIEAMTIIPSIERWSLLSHRQKVQKRTGGIDAAELAGSWTKMNPSEWEFKSKQRKKVLQGHNQRYKRLRDAEPQSTTEAAQPDWWARSRTRLWFMSTSQESGGDVSLSTG